ncbi:MAG: hypothetical protein WCR58_05835 [Bacteroidales bacterium]|jgi:tetratricopeptide (TPR) repeat protein|nr:hypothetical protein [Bacteroidales bacterium]MDD3702406.1 hypothetical protein [Bacteroidales bacterium]MDY0369195.1 hypothetical protein [Bacteroidales bacterium]
MKAIVYLFLFVGVLLSSCAPKTTESETLEDQMQALEAKLFGEENEYNPDDAVLLMSLYLQAADETENDSLVVEYLFKAADLMMYHAEPHQTISVYDRIINEFPVSDKAVMSLFLKAFVYDVRLSDTMHARQTYQDFLRLYPNHPLVPDVEMSIKNLGKSLEELVSEFESVN